MSWQPVAEVETPYTRGQRVWAGRMGAAWMRAKAWFFAFVAMTAICAGLVAYQWRRGETVPVSVIYVQFDAEGAWRVLGEAPVVYDAPQVMIEKMIRTFVHITRSIELDPVQMKRRWIAEAYKWVTPRGANLLNEWGQERDPFKKAGKETIDVKVNQVMIRSNGSYEVRWVETRRDHNNLMIGKPEAFIGVYTLKAAPPKSREKAVENPAAHQIDHFSVSRDK